MIAFPSNDVDVYGVSVASVVDLWHIKGFVHIFIVQASAYCLTWLWLLDQQ